MGHAPFQKQAIRDVHDLMPKWEKAVRKSSPVLGQVGSALLLAQHLAN